jgi:hypothetical protein
MLETEMNASRRALASGVLLAAGAPVFAQDTTRVSVDSSGGEGNDNSTAFSAPAMSADGRFVVFDTGASNLVVGDSNGCQDIFVHDRVTGTTEMVSVDSSGLPGNN